jgi:hypothetical protein
MPPRDADRFEQARRGMAYYHWAVATVAPRGIGPTRFADPGSKADVLARRRFALIGQTLDGQRVWDVRRALQALNSASDLANVPVGVQGRGDMAGIVLHAALFEPSVKRIDLWHPTATYRDGPTFLNVLRHFDMPQAVALALPTPVTLSVRTDADTAAWAWAGQLGQNLAPQALKIRTVGD